MKATGITRISHTSLRVSIGIKQANLDAWSPSRTNTRMHDNDDDHAYDEHNM